MNIGIIADCLAVAAGGFLGALIKNRLEDSFKIQINRILGLASLGMGISSIVLMQRMPSVIFALILGTALGLLVRLGDRIRKAAVSMNHIADKNSSDETKNAMMVTAVVLFCASGTGIYGALTAGMSGDASILLAKSILDFFTAMIFACTLGRSVSLIAVPQFVILFTLYLLAGIILPLTTAEMIGDFKACGGFIMIATGFRMLQLVDFPIADMIPSMVLVLPFSALWGFL